MPWYTHSVQFIEVWGVKKQRPVFTYRVREGRTLTLVELKSPQVCSRALPSLSHLWSPSLGDLGTCATGLCGP